MNEIFSLILFLIVLAFCIYVASFEASVLVLRAGVLVLVLKVGVLVLVLVLGVAVLLTTLVKTFSLLF